MDLPVDVNAWKYETVLEIVRSSTLEPYEFDFKATLNPKGSDADEIKANIRKCACAMANSDGGFIIFGVLNKGGTPESRIVGIEVGHDWSSRFDEHAKAIRPQITFAFTRNPIPLPNDGSKCIFVVRIPQSPRRPHEFEGRFYRRNHGGSADYMSALDVRDLMLYTEGRLSKLTLLRIHLDQIKSVAQYIAYEKPHLCAHRFETSAIAPLVADTCGLFPPGNQILREVSKLSSFASEANQLLDMLSDAAWYKPGQQERRATWEGRLGGARMAVEDTCKKVEEELAKYYGPVKP